MGLDGFEVRYVIRTLEDNTQYGSGSEDERFRAVGARASRIGLPFSHSPSRLRPWLPFLNHDGFADHLFNDLYFTHSINFKSFATSTTVKSIINFSSRNE